MTKLSGQFTAVLFDGYDLSGRSRQMDWNVDYTEEDASAFLDGAQNSQAGLSSFDGNLTAYMDPDDTDLYVNQSWEALKTPATNEDRVLMMLFGEGAIPDEGNIAVATLVDQFSATVPSTPLEKVMLTANFRGRGYEPQSGVVGDYATLVTSKTCDTIDLGGVEASGLSVYLIVSQGASEDTPGTDTYEVKIQHNTVDNGSWVDYLTFTSDGSIREGEYLTSAVSCNQFIRVLVTNTGGSGDSYGYAVVICVN